VPAYEAALSAEHAGKLQVSIDVVASSVASMVEARRTNDLLSMAASDKAIRTDPAVLTNWYDRGARAFRAGLDADAIRDFSHYIEKGGETGANAWKLGGAHRDRVLAAARLGRKEDAEKFLNEAVEFNAKDQFRERLLRTWTAAVVEPDDAVLEGFEEYARQWAHTEWAPREVATAYAYAAGTVRASDPRRFQAYVEKAVLYLEQAIRNGLRETW
jgi:tetratricopeptide (TPR) repeat protein